jgi:hypothetical protein
MFVEEGQMQERMMEDNNGIGGEVARWEVCQLATWKSFDEGSDVNEPPGYTIEYSGC